MSKKEQKYAAIATALSWEQEPESIDEGLFLQPEEASVVNAALAAAADTATQLTAVQQTVTERDGQIATLNTQFEAEKTKNTTQAARITELENEVATLGKQSSGPGGSSTVTAVDEATGDKTANKKVSLNDAAHPLNQAVSQRVKKAAAKNTEKK